MKIVKSIIPSLVFATALLSAVGAHATVIDTINANPDIKITPTLPLTLHYDLNNQGFVAGVTKYTSGQLAVRLTDTSGNETGTIKIGDQSTAILGVQNLTRNDPSPAGTSFLLTLDANSLADLDMDGVISVSIDSTRGSFFFADSTLTLEQASNAVPEPVSLALMSAGLFGIGATRRRKNK